LNGCSEREISVNQERCSISVDPAQFRTTRWSVILAAAEDRQPGSQEALAELCQHYWHPLYTFARRHGYGPHDAQDLTQGFFLHLLEHSSLQHADPLKGKFRSFLLASFRNFLLNEADRARSLKRGGDREFICLDVESAESGYLLEPADHLTAERIFDARWAMILLTRPADRLREEWSVGDEISRFEVLIAFVGTVLPSYGELAKSLGISPGAAKTTVHRFRRRFATFVRQEVGRTVSDPAEIGEEIRALCDALVAAEGRL
jgi:RNA polymerase sigma factor (sigma-70 family)